MFKAITKNLLACLAALIMPISVNAQSLDGIESEAPLFFTEIQSTDFTEVNSPVIFTARPQFNDEEFESVVYSWDFNDGNFDEGEEVAHAFTESGTYSVSLTVTIDGQEEFIQVKEIFVAVKAALMITDMDDEIDKIESILNLARESDIYIKLTESFASQSQFLSEEVLARKLTNDTETVNKLETIIVWTEGGSGLNALTRYQQSLENSPGLNNTTIIVLSNNLDNLSRVKRQYNQLNPKEIIVVQQAGIFQFLDTPNITAFKEELQKGGFDYELIDRQSTRLAPWNFMSFFIDFLTEKGIPDNTLILILLLPLIATVIAFMKQVIGITTLGIYTPTIITLTFLVLGLQFGIVILFFIIAMGTFAHRILKPLKLLYIPKMALVMTSVALIIFLLLTLTVYLELFDIEFISLAIFPVVVMGTLTEKFVSIRSEKGLPASIIMMIETFLVALIAYFFAGGEIDIFFAKLQWSFFQNLILNTPEIIAILIIINLFLGRWTGLRLTEYLNFRDVINDIAE